MGKKYNRPSLHRGLGFTLLEITAYLAIISVLLVGLLLMFINNSNSEKSNESVQEVVSIIAAIHSSYSGMADYSTLTDAHSFSRVNNISAKWRLGQNLVTPYGDPITITNDSNKYIVIVFPGVPTPSCVRLLVNDYGPNLVSVNTGTSAVYDKVLTPIEASIACQISGNGNVITWRFL